MKIEYTDGKKFTKGSIYEGDWKNGEPHGRFGILYFPNKAQYRGSWKNGKFHGRGEFKYSNGIVHEGDFEKGQFVYGHEHRPIIIKKSKTKCYKILNIPESATKNDIKKAYRKLALKYHPDRNKAQNAKRRFMEIQEAYQILYEGEKEDQIGGYRIPIKIDNRKRIRDKNKKSNKKSKIKTNNRQRQNTKKESSNSDYCMNCGNELSSSARFCGSCGNKMNKSAKKSTRKEENMGDVVKILIVIGVIIILGGIFVGF